MNLTDRLLEIARTEDSSFALDELSNPDFSERFTNWAYYVPEPLQALWGELSTDARLVAAIAALRRKEFDEPRG